MRHESFTQLGATVGSQCTFDAKTLSAYRYSWQVLYEVLMGTRANFGIGMDAYRSGLP